MMRLVMEQSGFSLWPLVSLVIFFGTTLGMIFWIYRPGSSEFYRKLGVLAIEDPTAKNHVSKKVTTPQPSPEE